MYPSCLASAVCWNKRARKRGVGLPRTAVHELRRIAASQDEAVRVFKGIFPRTEIFWKDLAAAGIERFDERGRKMDFHSFRKTFATMLNLAGVNLRVAMEAMRHSDPRLTLKTCTDSEMLPVSEAFGRAHRWTRKV
jgi:integrase